MCSMSRLLSLRITFSSFILVIVCVRISFPTSILSCGPWTNVLPGTPPEAGLLGHSSAYWPPPPCHPPEGLYYLALKDHFPAPRSDSLLTNVFIWANFRRKKKKIASRYFRLPFLVAGMLSIFRRFSSVIVEF